MPKRGQSHSNVTAIKSESSLVIETWPLHDVKPYEKNARKIPPAAIEKIAKSLKEFGWRQPMVVDSDGVLIVGHARRLGAVYLGWTEGPVHVARDLSPAQIKAYRLMDNRSHQESDWDLDILKPELFELNGLDIDLSLTGFDDDELAVFLKTEYYGLTDDDAVPAVPDQPVTKVGDLWALGSHRLLCGNATDLQCLLRLIKDDKPDMLFTDPPYGIEVVRGATIGGDKPFGKNGFDSVVKAGRYAPIIGDDGIETALAAYEACKPISVKIMLFWGGNHYAHKLPPAKCWVIWDKETDGNFGDGEIAWCSAPKSVRIFRHKWSGMLKASEHGEKRVHPTQKPVALAEWAFTEFIPKGVTVLDVFLGSGSTLIACEKTHRTCLGMELSEPYCDVIVKRWQDFTGQSATLEGDGRTFDAIKSERFLIKLGAQDQIKEEVANAG